MCWIRECRMLSGIFASQLYLRTRADDSNEKPFRASLKKSRKCWQSWTELPQFGCYSVGRQVKRAKKHLMIIARLVYTSVQAKLWLSSHLAQICSLWLVAQFDCKNQNPPPYPSLLPTVEVWFVTPFAGSLTLKKWIPHPTPSCAIKMSTNFKRLIFFLQAIPLSLQ